MLCGQFERARFLIGVIETLQIYCWQWKLENRTNKLRRLSVDDSEGGSQDFVTANDFVERLLQCRHVKQSRQTKCERDVIGSIAWSELIQEPQALLRK